jgi:hypothetical protein
MRCPRRWVSHVGIAEFPRFYLRRPLPLFCRGPVKASLAGSRKTPGGKKSARRLVRPLPRQRRAIRTKPFIGFPFPAVGMSAVPSDDSAAAEEFRTRPRRHNRCFVCWLRNRVAATQWTPEYPAVTSDE